MKKIPNLHLLCSTEDIRESMQYVYVGNGDVVATNAIVLAKFKTESIFSEIIGELPEKPFLVHKDSWKILTQTKIPFSYDEEKESFRIHYRHHDVYLKVRFESEFFKYPTYSNLFSDLETNEPIGSDFTGFSLNVQAIELLAGVIKPHCPVMQIIYHSWNKPLLIKDRDGKSDFECIVMPILL